MWKKNFSLFNIIIYLISFNRKREEEKEREHLPVFKTFFPRRGAEKIHIPLCATIKILIATPKTRCVANLEDAILE